MLIIGHLGGVFDGGLKVLSGSALPASVSEGTIFLKTTKTINKLYIQYTEPVLNEGDVYIRCTYDSQAVGALDFVIDDGKNKMTAYLLFATQKLNNIPVTLTAYIGKNGTWQQFSFEEYILFDQNGYKMNLGVVDGWDKKTGIWSDSGSGSVSFSDSTMYFSASTTYQGSGAYKFTSKQKIDLSPFKKITFDFAEMDMLDYCSITIGVYDTTNDRSTAVKSWSYRDGYPSAGIEDIDVSNITGEHSIYVNLSVNYSTRASIKISKIYLIS